jgi:alpha-L-rhamnosidase
MSSGDTTSVNLSSLTAEGQVAPLGLDVTPRFSWIISSSQNGDIQTSYHIRVSKVKAGNAEIWDSGVVKSKKSYLIEYAGSALSPDTHYFWSVDVVTKFGSSMSSSQFTTGLFSESDWGASSWIGKPTSNSSAPSLTFNNSLWIWSTEADPPNSAASQRAFRKTITAPKDKFLQSAFIIMTVDDAFILYVDGHLVGKSPNEKDSWKYPQQYKVPLSGNSSVFAVLATNLADVNSGGDSPAGLVAAIQVSYTDGTKEVVISDTTWKATNTIPQGFEQPSFNDASWSAAHSQGNFGVSPWNQDAAITSPLGEHPAPLLRKEFPLSKSISSARLYYSAGGYAHITINGAPASDRVLTPGFTKYDKTMLYVALDVKSLLQSSDNVIGAELGRSRYGSTQGGQWVWNNVSWHGEPRLRVVLSLAFTDGTTQHVVTDGSWKAEEGPTRLDDLWGGENYDGMTSSSHKTCFIETDYIS